MDKTINSIIERFTERVELLLGAKYKAIIGLQFGDALPTENPLGLIHISIFLDERVILTKVYKTKETITEEDIKEAMRDFLYLLIMEKDFSTKFQNNC